MAATRLWDWPLRGYDAPLPACVRAGQLSLAGASDLASTAPIVALPHFLSHDRTDTVVTGGIAESVKEALLAPNRGIDAPARLRPHIVPESPNCRRD